METKTTKIIKGSIETKSIKYHRKVKIKISKICMTVFLFIYSLICLYPIYFSVISSLKNSAEVFSDPYSFPKVLHFQNYVTAFNVGHIGQYFINTVYLTVASLLLTAVVSSMASFLLSRFKFRIQNFLFIFFIAGLMIPMQSTIIPLAFIFGKFNLNDNYTILILLYTAFCIPMSILIITGFMKSIPASLEEAAIIDGCTPFGVYTSIIIPLAMPSIATASIFNFISSWNNLIFPLIFIRTESLSTISIGLLSFFGERESDYGSVMAAVVITMLPAMIIYILMQEKVEKGLTAGAVKG